MKRSPHLEKLMLSHIYQGNSNNCGPCSIAIIAKTIRNQQTEMLDSACNFKPFRWNGIFPIVRRIPNWATFPWGIVDGFKELGIKSKWRICAKRENLLANIEQGIFQVVIIGEWKHLWAHYKILVAYDDEKGYGFVDPGSKTALTSWQSEKEFLRQWKFLLNSLIEAYQPCEINFTI